MSFCSCSICCWRGRYLASKSACAFFNSAVCNSAPCMLTTATFVCAHAMPADSAIAAITNLCIRDNPQDLVLTQDQILLTVQLHIGTGILTEKDAIARLYVRRGAVAVIEQLAVTHGHHFGLLRFLFRRI